MAFIRCEGLVKIYKAEDLEVVALEGLDLEVAAGEMMAVVGPSGSGKSTLLHILGALELPSAGRCIVGDWDLLRLTPARQVRYRREVVGFVWQNPARNLIPYLTALDNVLRPMQLAGMVGAQARRRALELLDAVGLGQRARHRPQALSGGEQQRVAVAVALANRPQLLLADEPTGSVDTATAGQILATFRAVNRAFGTTVIIVTHDMGVARQVDRYVRIRDGKVAQEAVPAGAGGGVGEELIVVDRRGRLQIPPELLARAGLEGRVRVHVEENQVIITKS